MNARSLAVFALIPTTVAAPARHALAQKSAMDHGSMGTAAQPGMMAQPTGAMAEGDRQGMRSASWCAACALDALLRPAEVRR